MPPACIFSLEGRSGGPRLVGASDEGEWPTFHHDNALTGEQSPGFPAPPIEVPLNDGWSLIGSGRLEPVLLAECCVTDGGATCSYEDAIGAGWVQTMLYYYTPAGYRQCRADGAGEDAYLRHQYGYWQLSYRGGLTLLIPGP